MNNNQGNMKQEMILKILINLKIFHDFSFYIRLRYNLLVKYKFLLLFKYCKAVILYMYNSSTLISLNLALCFCYI